VIELLAFLGVFALCVYGNGWLVMAFIAVYAGWTFNHYRTLELAAFYRVMNEEEPD
jgi:hypothetical protein